MTQDWLLTLLVISPFLLTVAIVILALTRRLAQNGQVHRSPEARAHVGADQMEEAKGIAS